MLRTSLAIAGLFLVTLAGIAPSARAEGNCPPGYFPIGGGSAGWEGCAPMGPDDGYYDDDYGGYDPGPQYQPEDWALLAAELQAENEARLAAMLADPMYQKLSKGYWDFDEDSRAKGTCVASYMSLRGGVLIMDWGGPQSGTYLAYFGPDVPPLQRMKRLKLTLVQSGESQTVRAYQGTVPWDASMGMVIFAVPGSAALLGAIEEDQDYKVLKKGKVLAEGEWHSGNEAKSFLSDCIAER
ncbi:MAG: hypothetical protein R3B98_02235 [Hyphomonas sp.]